MELVAASKMKKAQAAALAGRPYTQVMSRMLAALANRVEESQHPFLVQRPVRTRGILLVTTDKGLAGPLNANLFKVVSEIRTPAKFYVIGRKGAQFLARTHRDMVADFQVTDRVAFPRLLVSFDRRFVGNPVGYASAEVAWHRDDLGMLTVGSDAVADPEA